MQIHSVGIDLGKTTFHLVALGTAGKVLARKKFTQKQLLAYTANMQTSLIGLEAWPRPSSLPSVTMLRSARGESSQHGSALCHVSTRPAVRRSCLASVSEATRTCAGS
jgi:hypothetical protein